MQATKEAECNEEIAKYSYGGYREELYLSDGGRWFLDNNLPADPRELSHEEAMLQCSTE